MYELSRHPCLWSLECRWGSERGEQGAEKTDKYIAKCGRRLFANPSLTLFAGHQYDLENFCINCCNGQHIIWGSCQWTDEWTNYIINFYLMDNSVCLLLHFFPQIGLHGLESLILKPFIWEITTHPGRVLVISQINQSFHLRNEWCATVKIQEEGQSLFRNMFGLGLHTWFDPINQYYCLSSNNRLKCIWMKFLVLT